MSDSKIRISTYGTTPAPSAETFSKGATTPADIQRGCDMRRELSREQSTTKGPVSKD
jgi:hypothetical protein